MVQNTNDTFEKYAFDALQELVPATGGFSALDDGSAEACTVECFWDSGTRCRLSLAREPLLESLGLVKDSTFSARADVLLPRDREQTDTVVSGFPNAVAGARLERTLVIVLADFGGLHGLVGLQRHAGEPPFSLADASALRERAIELTVRARLELRVQSLERQVDAARALDRNSALLLVDIDGKRANWVGDDSRPALSRAALSATLQAAAMLRAAWANGEEVNLSSIALPFGSIVNAASLEGPGVGTSCRWIALRIACQSPREQSEPLSPRERDVAQMLASGFTAVNIAAICGLSENTVRTYVRRLYRKLAVSNRADLVRQLLASAVPIA